MWRHLLAARHRAIGLLAQLSPLQLVGFGYASYILIGAALLALPICHRTDGLRWIDHLFIATSAVSTTGLVTISPSDSYNGLGQFIVMMLFQFGGLGYMVITSFTLLAVAGRLSPLRERITAAALTLPEGFEAMKFIRVIVLFTVAIEMVGAAAMYPVFVRHAAPHPLWQAIFHSVSAFCTAGFGLLNNSFEDYRDDLWLNVVICVLSYLGAIGFIVMHDVWTSLARRKPSITFTSKVILVSTLAISLAGTGLFMLDEPSIGSMSFGQRALASVFQVMTASTTVGFNTLPIGELSASSVLLLVILMIIGASPAGTGGGLKTTTFTALWAQMTAVLRRKPVTTFLGRQIPDLRIRAAAAATMFYLLTLTVGLYLLELVESFEPADQLFECASALGTVGLSRGITGGLSVPGKWIIIALMFLGRLGPLVLGLALFRDPQVSPRVVQPRPKQEDVAI